MKIPQRYLDRTPALKYHSVQQELFDDTYAIKHRFTVVPAGRRCLEKGTMVSTPIGPVSIDNLKVGDKVIGYNEYDEPELTTITSVHINGEQLVSPLSSRNKKYLSATLNHRLYICHETNTDQYEKQEISTLSSRKRVKKCYAYNLIKGGDVHFPYAYMIGVMLGDGCCSADKTYVNKKNIKHLYVSTNDESIVASITKQVKGRYWSNSDANYTWTIRTDSSIYDTIPYYKEWCSGKKSYEKYCEWDVIDKWDKASCLAFLAGVIDSDGSVYALENRLNITIGMQAKSVIDVCSNIIYKYFQEKTLRYTDNREKYKNGQSYIMKISNNLLAKRVYKEIRNCLHIKTNMDTSVFKNYNIISERMGVTTGEPYLAETYDITVSNSTNMYILHNGAIVTSNSGKSEIVGKRRLVARAVHGVKGMQNPKYFVAAPTHSQVKKIYWDDLKILCLPWINIAKRPSESNLIIYLNRGQEIHLIGMDKPERIEGPPWVGGVLDEYANMKKHTWLSHVRPALSTPGMPPGWCDFVGVPEGRNHYYRLFKSAKAEQLDKGSKSEWGVFHWKSADILDPKEIESAKKDMDELTFQQEYEGCHLPETRVMLFSGIEKPIVDIVPGDFVCSNQNGEIVEAKVLKSECTGSKEIVEIMTEDCQTFRASKYHKMRVDGRVALLNECDEIDVVFNHWKPVSNDAILAGIIGFTLGDGSISIRKSNNKLCSNWYFYSAETLDEFVSNLNYIGVDCGAKGGKKGMGYSLSLGHKTTKFLVNNGCSVGKRIKQKVNVPGWIKKSNWEVQRAFIAGLFGADGITPVDDSRNGKSVKLGLSLRNEGLIKDCFEILKSRGIKASILYNKNMWHLYVNKEYLSEVGYLYDDRKSKEAWLWVHYINGKYLRKLNIENLRKEQYTWEEIGNKLNITKGSAYQLGKINKNSVGCSHDYPKFSEWKEGKYKNNILKLKIISKKDIGTQSCRNITVDSSDNGYILANGFDNYNSFINFKGRAYYNFSDDNIAKLSYDPNKPLILCFDFNVDPGVCAVIQEQNYVDKQGVPIIGKTVVGVIGEVYIPKNSNTVTVCNKVIQDWGKHQGRVMIYGDATGGSRGSAKISGTDWDLVRSTLTPTFDSRLHFCVPKINPKERSRINTVNSLCKSVSGEVRFQVDPLNAPHVVLDMEGVSLIEGGSGELDKKVDLSLTHISDAIGYFISKEYPIYEGISGMESFEGF